MKHTGTKTLQTERLILRRFTIEDAEMMFNNWGSDDEVTRYLTWPTHKSIEDSKWFINMCLDNYKNLSFYNWAIELKDTHELIGNVSFVNVFENTDSLEFGWVIGRKYWGEGYAPEACNRIIDLAFDEIGANCVFAIHDVNNPKSGRAMQKLGMKFEGIIRQCNRNNQGIVDCARYSILKEERLDIKGTDFMNGKIENKNEKIIFTYKDKEYELRSHPYEPCMYIYKDDVMIKILHNAFDVYDLPDIFDSNETVRAIDGKDFDKDDFCKVLIAAINDERYEMNWTFAANLVK